MIRHTRQQPTENETAIAKARLRVAALQVTPMDVVREHPWASVLGTSAATLTIAALVGGPPKTKIIYRDVDRDGNVVREKHGKEKSKGGLFAVLATGILSRVMTLAVDMGKQYMDKKVPVEPGATDGAPRNGRMNGESGDAMG